MKTTIQLSEREQAAVLAGLRLLQRFTERKFHPSPEEMRAIQNIATMGFRYELLKPRTVDRLCERINYSEPLKIIVEVSGGNVDPVHVSHEADVTVYDHDNIEAGDEAPLDLKKETETMNSY